MTYRAANTGKVIAQLNDPKQLANVQTRLTQVGADVNTLAEEYKQVHKPVYSGFDDHHEFKVMLSRLPGKLGSMFDLERRLSNPFFGKGVNQKTYITLLRLLEVEVFQLKIDKDPKSSAKTLLDNIKQDLAIDIVKIEREGIYNQIREPQDTEALRRAVHIFTNFFPAQTNRTSVMFGEAPCQIEFVITENKMQGKYKLKMQDYYAVGEGDPRKVHERTLLRGQGPEKDGGFIARSETERTDVMQTFIKEMERRCLAWRLHIDPKADRTPLYKHGPLTSQPNTTEEATAVIWRLWPFFKQEGKTSQSKLGV